MQTLIIEQRLHGIPLSVLTEMMSECYRKEEGRERETWEGLVLYGALRHNFMLC